MTKPQLLLSVKGLCKTYAVRRAFQRALSVRAVDDVSFQVEAGRTLAVVGESGCGKSTLAKCLMRIEDITSGEVEYSGQSATDISDQQWRKLIQMIFQDPYSSLNPRKKIIDAIAEPLVIAGGTSRAEVIDRARQMMVKVGLRAEFADRYPHMLSGGQRQRVGIARALMTSPQLLICDEPVSALDVSIQAQVLNLLMDLQDELGLTYLFISHDLSIVRHVADQVMVMYLGQVMELGDRNSIFFSPSHPYTQALLKSHPDVQNFELHQSVLKGETPSPLNPPAGCPFQTRCPHVMDICRRERPPLYFVKGRQSACHLHADQPLGARREVVDETRLP